MAYQLSYICKILTIKLFYGRSNESRLPIEMPWGTFQSTHLREVRRSAVWDAAWVTCFNPRTYERCDLHPSLLFRWPSRFNPRTYERCDSCFALWSRRLQMFQSTHLREVRLIRYIRTWFLSCFNPRTYERCDSDFTIKGFCDEVSIHAPTRGATRAYEAIYNGYMRFNPRTYERCDQVGPLK